MDAKTGDVLWTDKTPRGECGAILDAGRVLLALTSDYDAGRLQAQQARGTRRWPSTRSPTRRPGPYPIIAGNRVFVKDRDSLALWTIE